MTNFIKSQKMCPFAGIALIHLLLLFWLSGAANLAAEEWTATAQRVGTQEDVRAGTLTDFNGDGRQDILAVSPEAGLLVVFIQKPDSHWEPHVLSEQLEGAIDVTAGDLTGDGLTDAVVTLRKGGVVGIIQQDDPKLPWMRVDIAGMLDYPNAREARLTDLDGDDDLDVVFLNDSSTPKGGVYWAESLNPVNGFLGESWKVQLLLSVPEPQDLYLLDLAGDERLEPLVTARDGINRIFWLQRPQKAGGEWKPTPVAEWSMPGPTVLGDVDGDGLGFDIVSQMMKEGAERPQLAWCRFTGKGWEERQLIAEEIPPLNSLALANLDDDPGSELIATAASTKGPGILFLIDRTADNVWESHVLAKDVGFAGELLPVNLQNGQHTQILSFLGPLGHEDLSNGVFFWEIVRRSTPAQNETATAPEQQGDPAQAEDPDPSRQKIIPGSREQG